MDVIRAAGGIPTRRIGDTLEVVLVHRPSYDDWSFPKGKLEGGETEAEAAVREVEEETTIRGELGRELGTVTYVDNRGRPKTVRYWEMVVSDGVGATGNSEVDDARWVPVDEAERLLTYAHDRDLLTRLMDAHGDAVTVPVYVVRHVQAANRSSWHEPDELRPITKSGLRQAQRLVDVMDGRPLTRLMSSPYLRCIQSLEPISEARGLDIDLSHALSEGQGPEGARRLLVAAASDGPAALCSHGDVISLLIDEVLASGVAPEDGEVGFKKASIWALGVRGDEIATARYFPPPSGKA